MVKSTEKDPQWEILLSISKFDFSWRPDPSEPPFIYVFGNKWNDAETEPTVMYRVEGATEYKFLDSIIATPKVNMTNWLVRNELDLKAFDFSWRPNPNVSGSTTTFSLLVRAFLALIRALMISLFKVTSTSYSSGPLYSPGLGMVSKSDRA